MHCIYYNKIAMLIVKIDGIYSIFPKDRNGNFTKKALLYQDMLKYSIEENNPSSFRHWDLASWLMKKNQEFINKYKDLSTRNITYGNRVEHTQKRTKDRLNDLINLGLIEVIGTVPQKKGIGNVYLYKYTYFGQVLAWIIESFDPSKRELANQGVYPVIVSMFKKRNEYSSTSNIFFSVFFKNCKEKGVFGNIVDRLREILYSGKMIMTVPELLQVAINSGYKDLDEANQFFDLYDETLNQLDPEIREFHLYDLKLDIQRRMDKLSTSTKVYEKVRFKIRGDHDTVALEGFCKICNAYFTIDIYILAFRAMVILQTDEEGTRMKCPGCNTEKSLIFPHLL
jgi:hypothetical protein